VPKTEIRPDVLIEHRLVIDTIEVIASIALVVSMVDSSISSHLLFFKNSWSDATYVYKVHTHTHVYTIKCYGDKCIDIISLTCMIASV